MSPQYRVGDGVHVTKPRGTVLKGMEGLLGTVQYVDGSGMLWVLFRNGWRMMCFSDELGPAREPAPAPVNPEVLAPKTAWERLMEDEQCG